MPDDTPERAGRGGRISRRSLLMGTAGAATARGAGRRRAGRRVAVIGAGAFGGWSALHLLRTGARVTLFDAWGPGNSRASSGGESRIIRGTYGPDRVYVEMVARSLQIWTESERQWRRPLLRTTGAIWMVGEKDAYEKASLPLLRRAGLPFEELSVPQAAARFPQINFDSVSWVIYEPRAGYQEVFYFGTPAGDGRFSDRELPVWIDNTGRLFYGIPGNERRGFKIADDTRGPPFDPTGGDRTPDLEALGRARSYLEFRFPALKGAPLLEARVCQYENSPDGHFFLDRHPRLQNAWLVGGGSGHGFKHGPALGERVARLVSGRAEPDAFFSLRRPSAG